jgi:peptide chain release factor 3
VRDGGCPSEEKFSGFVFKIQANMDPKHRDRIAFMRVCSGRFERGMKMKHLRHEPRHRRLQRGDLHGPRPRDWSKRPYAGDIIGIPNHGNIQIGDSFSEGEAAGNLPAFRSFAPELFRSRAHPQPALKIKQLHKGLQQLGEEGAVQVFKPANRAPI